MYKERTIFRFGIYFLFWEKGEGVHLEDFEKKNPAVLFNRTKGRALYHAPRFEQKNIDLPYLSVGE